MEREKKKKIVLISIDLQWVDSNPFLHDHRCSNRSCLDHSAIYTTGLPPATLAANLAALTLLEAETNLPQKALDNARYFTQLMQLTPAQSAIVPLIIGESTAALTLSQKLEDAGFYISAIRPPTVPKGQARLRFTFSATHKKEDIEKLVKRLKD